MKAKKQFYHHIVSSQSLTLELESLELSQNEKDHLSKIAESSLHYTVLDIVLTSLPDEDKKTFLKHAASDDHEKTWKFVKDKVENAQEKIKNAAESLKKELQKDIEDLKTKA
ncbi:MAG TPA: hypothetical protein VLF68_00530 [Candidatus Saccharimonadales bacterium]|nr:hypothetical protein [Candidatus Saccharimonadales bacterium]